MDAQNNNGINNKVIILAVLVVIAILFLVHQMNHIDMNINVVLKEADDPPLNLFRSADNNINRRVRHLRVRYVYTCPLSILNKLRLQDKLSQIKPIFYYHHNSVVCACFFVTEVRISLKLNTFDANNIEPHPYKMYDTYVMGDTRTFNDIYDILINQGYDRDTYGKNMISTTFLNELCSNKLEYITYFVKHGLMVNTVITKNNKTNKFKGSYVKAPYSSRSVCAQFEQIKKNKCYVEEGVIVQTTNEMLKKYEIKCYVLDGNIYMTLIRLDGMNSNICIKDFDQVTGETETDGLNEIKQLLIQHADDLRKTARKAYYRINSLIGMRLKKLEKDEKETKKILQMIRHADPTITQTYIRDIRYILIGLVNSEKIKLINHLNSYYKLNISSDILTNTVNSYASETDETEEKLTIYDRFMRIDMALPDGNKYNQVTVTEIEPFASGIYLYSTVGPCMINDDLNTFENITTYNLHKILGTKDDTNTNTYT